MPFNWIYLTASSLTTHHLRELALDFPHSAAAVAAHAEGPIHVAWPEGERAGSIEQSPRAITVELYPLDVLTAEHEPGEWREVCNRLGAAPNAAINIELLHPSFRNVLLNILRWPDLGSSEPLGALFLEYLRPRVPGDLLHSPEYN